VDHVLFGIGGSSTAWLARLFGRNLVIIFQRVDGISEVFVVAVNLLLACCFLGGWLFLGPEIPYKNQIATRTSAVQKCMYICV
jgi:hypothetical protein